MIDIQSLSSIDEVNASFTQSSGEAYYKKYQEFKDPIATVVTAPYCVLEAYLTERVTKNGNATQYLNLALLLLEKTEFSPKESYIRIRLRGLTRDISGKVVSNASPEFSSFVSYCRSINPNSINTTREWVTNWDEHRAYLEGMINIQGILSFVTTYANRGYTSYGAKFFIQSQAPNQAPLSIYEAFVLQGNYRDPQKPDFITLNQALQAKADELFKEDTPPAPTTTPQERAAAIPVAELTKVNNDAIHNDEIPF